MSVKTVGKCSAATAMTVARTPSMGTTVRVARAATMSRCMTSERLGTHSGTRRTEAHQLNGNNLNQL